MLLSRAGRTVEDNTVARARDRRSNSGAVREDSKSRFKGRIDGYCQGISEALQIQFLVGLVGHRCCRFVLCTWHVIKTQHHVMISVLIAWAVYMGSIASGQRSVFVWDANM